MKRLPGNMLWQSRFRKQKGKINMKLKMFCLQIFFVLGLAALSHGTAHAQGECSNSSWQSYNAGGIDVSVRRCVDSDGYSHIDVRNPYSEPLCVTIVATVSNERWNNWPVYGFGMLSRGTSTRNEGWRVGATYMQGNSCPA